MKTLLLWDIDGTLINSGGAGLRALRAALESIFAINGSLDDIEFAGRTDRWIMRRIFEKFGVPASDDNFTRFFEGYVAALPGQLGANPEARVLPGVRPLLDAVRARGDIAQGLLTGNVRQGAEVKLSFHGLWHYFPFGAFADDSEHRDELGPHAVRRALAHAGVNFDAERTWVIGDTPHDIACGKCIGARTLAVATGLHDAATLAKHHPSAVFKDLNDHDAFLQLIDS